MPQGWDFGALGVPRWSKKIIFKHGHVNYQIDEDDEQNRMQVQFLSYGQTCDLGWGQRSNIFTFLLPCQFQKFLIQTFCVFAQMKDTKHIRWDFYSVAWVMPQGWDFGAVGVPRGSNVFFQTWSCGISNRWGWQAEQNASNIFILGSNRWPWGEVKWSNIINMSISKIFIPNFVCVLTNKR